MLIVRFIAVMAVIAIGASTLAYLFSGQRRYLVLAWRIIRYAVLAVVILLSLFFLERVAVLL